MADSLYKKHCIRCRCLTFQSGRICSIPQPLVLQEERDSFGANLLGRGLVDSFRQQYPEIAGYTWWSRRLNCRIKNKGWRLDYFLVRALRLSVCILLNLVVKLSFNDNRPSWSGIHSPL